MTSNLIRNNCPLSSNTHDDIGYEALERVNRPKLDKPDDREGCLKERNNIRQMLRNMPIICRVLDLYLHDGRIIQNVYLEPCDYSL
jgi:hypothetical protein